uniref:BORCS6 domain-containing protein n=1 Tax=Strongyloides venezuelensis TaxID=75913 RepID=A0A0K0F2N5_STRVS
MSSSEIPKTSTDVVEEIKAMDMIEKERQTLGDEVDNCLRSLRGTMRGIIDLTTEGMELYHSSITRTCDHAEQAVKHTFSVIAKSEELTQNLKKIDEVYKQVKELREITDNVAKSLKC